MSFKLKELQEVAEKKAKEYGEPMDCLAATLYTINDALKEVDDTNYIDSKVLKAISPLPMGYSAYDGPCGVLTAGSVAIGLKFGTADQKDRKSLAEVKRRSRDWVNWFRYMKFGSTNCVELRGNPPTFGHCIGFIAEGSKKLVELLAEGNPKVIR